MFCVLIFLLALLLGSSSSSELVSLDDNSDLTKPLVQVDIGEDAEKDVAELEQYFKTYLKFDNTPSAAESSDDGHGRNEPKIDLTRTPAFVERVIQLQKEFGMEITGVLDKKLLQNSKKDRCGMANTPSDPNAPAAYKVKSMWESKHITKHNQYHLTYSFHTDTFPTRSASSPISERDVKQGVLSAMCMWEMNSNIRFIEDMGDNQPRGQADITVGFGKGNHGDAFPFDGKGKTLAHAFYPENGQLHFDADEWWYLAKDSTGDWQKRDVFTVAAHELGHNLGLDHSEDNNALMAPFYAFKGIFKSYVLPTDDKNGMRSMYGRSKSASPLTEAKSACRELRRQYRVTSVASKPSPATATPPRATVKTRSTTVAPTTTTTRRTRRRRTTTTTTTTTPKVTTPSLKPAGKPGCKDDPTMAVNCQTWKDMGYCSRQGQRDTMTRRCKFTCDLCPGEPNKPGAGEKTVPDSACKIMSFDALTTIYDGGEYYHSYSFKDDYYIETYIQLESRSRGKTYSLLNSTEHLKSSLKWWSDPKTTKPGSRKIQNMFPKTDTKSKPTAMLLTRGDYLLFDDQGNVDQYSRGGVTGSHVKRHSVGRLFRGFPHRTVDAAYREYETENSRGKYVVTLFKGNKIWQYQKFSTNGPTLQYEPISGRTRIDIAKWHGVPACNIDSVFKYKNVPYFLKGHIFWPAKSTEKMTGRDFTYHFFRCSSGSSSKLLIPSSCGRVSGTSSMPPTGNSARNSLCSIFFIATTLMLSLLTRLSN